MAKLKITEKIDTACRAYLACGNKSEAYRKAFDTSRMKSATVNKRAHELFDRDPVKQHLDTLRSEVKSEFSVSAEQKKKWLVDVIEAGLKHVVKLTDVEGPDGKPLEIDLGLSDSKAVISAIAELNKMDGDLAAQKVDMNANISQAERVKSLKEKYESRD